METQEGRTYAQIQGGQIHWIFTNVDLPEYNEETFTAVDITDVSPQPAIGWAADQDGEEWTFSAPAPASVNPSLAANLLQKSDLTILRCTENGVTVPSAWVTYRSALRAIVNGSSSPPSMPARPAYPANT